MFASQQALAGLFDVFRLEDGHTNWQYVANTSGTILILALSYTLFRLFLINREARRYGVGIDAHRRYPERVRAVTKDDVLRVARRVVDLGRAVVAIIRP